MDSHDTHNLECARAAIAMRIETAKTTAEQKKWKDLLGEIEREIGIRQFIAAADAAATK